MSFIVKASAALVSSGALVGLTLWFFKSTDSAQFEYEKDRRSGYFFPAIIIAAGLTGWLWLEVLRSEECDPIGAATIFAFAYFLGGVPTISMWRDAHRARLKREAEELERFARMIKTAGPVDPEHREQWEFERAARAHARRPKDEK